MRKILQKDFLKLLEIKVQIRQLELEAEPISERLMGRMEKYEEKTLKHDLGTAFIADHITTIYPEEVKKKIKRIKRRAEKDGKVTFKPTPYITVRLAKEKVE